MRPIPILLAAALASLGCGHTQLRQARLGEPAEISFVSAGGFFSYIIDPRTETCFLYGTLGGPSFAPVPCEKLKKNVPEAAKAITWLAEDSTSAVAFHEPHAPQSSVAEGRTPGARPASVLVLE